MVQVGFGFPHPRMGFAAPEAAAEPLPLRCTINLTTASPQAGPEKLHPWAHSPTAAGQMFTPERTKIILQRFQLVQGLRTASKSGLFLC